MHFTFNCNYLEYIQVGGDFFDTGCFKNSYFTWRNEVKFLQFKAKILGFLKF